MTTEPEIIAELGLSTGGVAEKLVPSHVLARFSAEPSLFNEREPVLSIVKLISTQNWRSLESALINHYDCIKRQNILPLIAEHLYLADSRTEALELLALLHYEHQFPVNLAAFSLERIDFTRYRALKETSQETTDAGYRSVHDPAFRYPQRSLEQRSFGYLSSRPWILEFFIRSEANSARNFVDSWWPLVVPALLNFLDTSDLSTKLRGVELVTQLATNHARKLDFSGLISIFENSIQPCLSFLPPLVDPSQTKMIHRPAMVGLVRLAQIYSQTRPLDYNKRLNFLAREGCFKPFSHANEKVDLYQYFLANLRWYIDSVLKSLTVIHLHATVRLCNQILTDPFIEYSPELIESTCLVVEALIQWAWPRLTEYRYTLMLGLTKANALNTQAFQMLKPSAQEKETLTSIAKKG